MVTRACDRTSSCSARCLTTSKRSTAQCEAVWPAAGLLAQARAWSAETLVNSLEEPANLERGDRFLPGRAVDVVPRLVEEWLARWAGPSEPSDGLGR